MEKRGSIVYGRKIVPWKSAPVFFFFFNGGVGESEQTNLRCILEVE